MYFFFICFNVCYFLFMFSPCISFLLYVYMSSFDCKCNNLNRLGENINKTGHPPAHHSTANKYLSGSGWMSCICLLLFFSKVFCLCVVLLELCRLYMQKLKKTRRKQKNNRKTHKQKQKNSKNNKTKTEIQDIQPSTRPRINISQVPAGRFMFFSFLFVCFFSIICCCSFVFVVFV